MNKLAGLLGKCIVYPILLGEKYDGGNKYYKLKYNLEHAKQQGFVGIISFGGAWSNHIHALAKICGEFGLKSVGVIRGERPSKLSYTLQDAEAFGMQLQFVSRSDYRLRDTQAYVVELQAKFPDYYVVPEGGTNVNGVRGAAEIVSDITVTIPDYDLVVLPVGTGGTLAGIASALPADKKVCGIVVLKGAEYLAEDIAMLIEEQHVSSLQVPGYRQPSRSNWQVDHRFHCGGYAKCPDYLRDFILQAEADHHLRLDPVYTGKALYGLTQMANNGEIEPATRVVFLHTGGEQGRRGFGV